MNDKAPLVLVWMAQAAAQSLKMLGRSTARVQNRHLPTFLDDTFRSRAPPNGPQGHWCAGTAPLLRATWDTALWKSDDLLLGSTTCPACLLFWLGLRRAFTPRLTALTAATSFSASSTHLSFLCTLFYVIFSNSLGLKHRFLESERWGTQKKETSASSCSF